MTTATPLYVSSVQLFVAAQDGSAPSQGLQGIYEGGLFTQDRVQSYADIIGNTSVTAPVVAHLHVALTPQQLSDEISASSPQNTVLLNVHVTDRYPARAQALANATAQEFIALASQLEEPVSGVSPVKVSVSQPATFPTAPSSPRKALDIALGLLLGLLIGVFLAILGDRLDTTVRTAEELQELADAPVLSAVPYDRQARRRPLIAPNARTIRAEAFRTLRTNVQFIDVDERIRSLVITSPQSGDGKTTVACNLALVCAQADMRVVVVDTDLRLPRVATYFETTPSRGVTDVLRGACSLQDAVSAAPIDPRLTILASGAVPPNPSELVGSAKMKALISELEQQFDLVILDAPPLLPVTDAAVLATHAGGAILVTRYGGTRRPALRRAVDALARVEARLLGVVFNRHPVSGPDGYGLYYGSSYTGDEIVDETEPVSASA